MSTLSQFAGSGDTGRLKIKNGPYLDEISPPSSYGIRDFSAQNDHFMVITTDYRLYVGKRFNELIPCSPLDSTTFIPAFGAGSYDINIGGDPFPVDPSVVTTAISYYSNTAQHTFWRSSKDIPVKCFYDLPSAVSVPNVNGFTNNATSQLRSIIYSDGGTNKRLLTVNKSNSQGPQVHYHDDANNTWTLQTYSYSGTRTNFLPQGPGQISLSSLFEPTYLTIDPSTGNAVFMMSYFDSTTSAHYGFKCEYNPTTREIDITDVTLPGTGFSFTMKELSISSDGNTYVATSSLTPATVYHVSNDGGSTWTEHNMSLLTAKQCKHIGYAIDKFYTIASNTANRRGVVLSTSTPETPSSWQIEVIPGLEYPSILRDNKLGTACYISTGSFIGPNYTTYFPRDESHIIKKIV